MTYCSSTEAVENTAVKVGSGVVDTTTKVASTAVHAGTQVGHGAVRLLEDVWNGAVNVERGAVGMVKGILGGDSKSESNKHP